MFDANAELSPEGFCQISCDRCLCCSSASKIIQSLGGGSKFLQAVNSAQAPLNDLLSHPGFAATILVPTDEAWDAAMSRLSLNNNNNNNMDRMLNQVIKFHILPPESRRNALWTTPFMSLGPKMTTMYDGPVVLTSEKFPLPSNTTWRGGLTGFTISSPFTSAKVVKSDIPTCKGYINVIDSVLLPFDPSSNVTAFNG